MTLFGNPMYGLGGWGIRAQGQEGRMALRANSPPLGALRDRRGKELHTGNDALF